jgi:DNA glycosylase AlkZ-like
VKVPDPARVTWKRVAAFRLTRHHLARRARADELTKVPGRIGGAQAQLLLAGQMSIGVRVRNVTVRDVDAALWKEKTLVKAWCMRRTMFLVPSDELALFARGSALRAEREVRWVLNKGVPPQKLERLLQAVLDSLDEPIGVSTMAERVSKSLGYRLTQRPGGSGWGDRRKVPWIEFGARPLPAGYLLHIAGARGVYCCGPNSGGESTFVRADRWLPRWKDMPQARAEEELLKRYLRAYGPSTPGDFAIWTGMTARDAKRIWSQVEESFAPVDVEGWGSWVLKDDLEVLQEAKTEGPVVRLLPFFDSYLLGHKSHRNVVGPGEHRRVYRPQGWVSPVLLVDGRVAGVWSYARKGGRFAARVTPFSPLSRHTSAALRARAEELGAFNGASEVSVSVGWPWTL